MEEAYDRLVHKKEKCAGQKSSLGVHDISVYGDERYIMVYEDAEDGRTYCFDSYDVLHLDANPWNGNSFPDEIIKEARAIGSPKKDEPIEASVGSIEKVMKLWKKYYRSLIRRFPGDDSAGEFTVNQIVDSLIKADPDPRQKYVEWIIKSYLDGGIKRWEDILSRVNEALQKYRYLADRKLLEPRDKDINEICGLSGCTRKNRGQRGLVEVLKSYSEHLKKFEDSQEIKLAEGEVDVIFDSEEVKVIHPKTKAAACKYGKNTEWCTAATKGRNMFDTYNESGNLWIFIPKEPEHLGEKYQLFISMKDVEETEFEPFQLMNEHDEEKSFRDLFLRFDLSELIPKMNKTPNYEFRNELIIGSYDTEDEKYTSQADEIINGDDEIVRLSLTVAQKGNSTLLEKLDHGMNFEGCIKMIFDRESIGDDELRMIKYLTDNKLDKPDKWDMLAACKKADLRFVKYLREDLKLKCTKECLERAVTKDNLELVKYLVKIAKVKCTRPAYGRASGKVKTYLREVCDEDVRKVYDEIPDDKPMTEDQIRLYQDLYRE